MHASEAIELAGERVQLLAERALFWPAQSLLLIADLHLGKGEALRRGGIAVPRGGTRDDLQRLQALLEQTRAHELCVLGDFLHGAVTNGAWQEEWRAWRMHHADTRIAVVAGNHDRQLQRHAVDWDLELAVEGVQRGPFELRHVPRTGSRHVIAGHLHPRLRYPGLPGRWPAFWLRPGLSILPAFSRFTGGLDARRAEGDRCIACLDGLVAELPSR
ncbi:DNA ligase-associated metallophosphoesterase [Pseudoxanthomonas japonensis]|uniref:ligase-associated DNA damage response endonuclease PdeM n=1 Tax=Pseudoxanthomonas japonensis TaxID=69284 RepID=UPI00285505A7|nr:ligase-associated DNA damage response endonuclease PdeM [Pseudoxanthomonas japonensis]MDR7070342.1 DNA ligase-associated metallophosphoesterase [Pseudoxanthomonas japonensis]